MKKIKHLLSVSVLGLLSNLPGIAAVLDSQTVPPKISIQKPSFQVGLYRKINSLTMNLLIGKKLVEQLVIFLLYERGRVLHKEALGRRLRKYARLLNFAETKDGTYILEYVLNCTKLIKGASR